MKKSLLFIGIVLLSLSSFAQNISGDWYGTLNVPGTQLSLVLHIQKTDSGYKTTLDSPDQNANGIPVPKTTFQNDSLILDLSNLRATYAAKFDAEADRFKGKFTQVGQTFPLEFSRKKTEKTKPKRPQEPEKPYPYYSEDVSIQNTKDSVRLAGTLTMPKETGSFPAVVLINGSGPVNRNEEVFGHKLFLVISDYLTRNGIAVLRYDKRGIGKSTGSYSKATTVDFARDANAVFRYLRNQKGIDKKEVGLIGHSEGGTIAPIVAAKNQAVAFIVLLAGTGVPGSEVLLKQQELIGHVSGMTDTLLSVNKTINKKAYQLMAKSTDSVELRHALKSYFEKALQKHPEWNTQGDQGLSNEQFINHLLSTYMKPWFRYFLKYDPAVALKKVNCPVLALDGTHDMQVDADQNLPAIKKALKEGGNSEVTLKKLEGLNHLFQKSKTGSPSEYAEIEQTFSPKALKIIKDWILNKAI